MLASAGDAEPVPVVGCCEPSSLLSDDMPGVVCVLLTLVMVEVEVEGCAVVVVAEEEGRVMMIWDDVRYVRDISPPVELNVNGGRFVKRLVGRLED